MAEFASVLVRPEYLASFIRPLPDYKQQTLAALVTRRRQLLTMLGAERQRLQLAIAKVRPSIKAMIKAICAQLDDVEGQMVGHVNERCYELDKLLRSASSIGPVASATLIAELTELGTLNDREIAALLGVASMANDSGTTRGRASHLGRPLRNTKSALHGRPRRGQIQPSHQGAYQRLLAAGMLRKVALVTCMRKLQTTLSAMVKTNTPWDAEFDHA